VPAAGLAIAPLHGKTVDELLSMPISRSTRPKKEGGRVYRFFAPTLRAQAQSRRGLDAELRRAFASNELELHYQPQVRISDGAVTGAEALLRWRHKERGILGPGLFVDALADNPICPEVGRWIIRTACVQRRRGGPRARPRAQSASTCFPTALRHPTLIDDVEYALRESGLAPELLELEITENIALNHEEAAKPLRMLREQGVKIAFDDFGTGYASLSCLTMFPISRIKIDRSFVGRIANSAQDAAIIRSLITMAKEPRPRSHRRGRRDGGAGGLPAQRAMRRGAGLPLQQAAVGGGIRRLPERGPHRGCRHCERRPGRAAPDERAGSGRLTILRRPAAALTRRRSARHHSRTRSAEAPPERFRVDGAGEILRRRFPGADAPARQYFGDEVAVEIRQARPESTGKLNRQRVIRMARVFGRPPDLVHVPDLVPWRPLGRQAGEDVRMLVRHIKTG